MLIVLILSIVLGIDSLLLCMSMGMCGNKYETKRIWLLITSIGLFHFFMPIIGYLLSLSFSSVDSDYGRYLATAIFAFLGIKMIYDGYKIIKNGNEDEPICEELSLKKILMISFAVSIDAIVVGFSIFVSHLDNNIFIPSLLFSIFAFAMSAIGFFFGKQINKLIGIYATIIAGLIMLFLAFKTFSL